MRKFGSLGLILFVIGAAPVACTEPGTTTTGASSGSSSSGSSSSSSNSSSSSGAPGPGIKGTAIDIYRPTSGEETRPNTTSWTAIEAIADKVYPGTIDNNGNIDIPGVPEGMYLLALTEALTPELPANAQPRKVFYETDARILDLGRIYSGRPDLAPMTQPTYLTLEADFSLPWQAYTDDGFGNVQPLDDQLEFVSRNGGVQGTIAAGESLPEDLPPYDGSFFLTNWKVNALNVFNDFGHGKTLVDGSKGDDFHVVHDVMQQVGMSTLDGNPWNGYQVTTLQEEFVPTSFTMTNGGTSALVGKFKMVPQKTFALDFKGSAFNALFANVPFYRATNTLSVYFEAGAPEPAIGAFAQLVNATIFSGTGYTNPDENCHGSGCDLAVCATTCDPGTTALAGDHAHTYSYGNPFTTGQEIAAVGVYFYHSVRNQLPETTPENVNGYFLTEVPASEVNGKPLQPTLGFPENINVNDGDTSYDQVTPSVGTTPTIRWDAPKLGTPTSYRVFVFDTTDFMDVNGATLRRRNVATLHVKGTSVTIPEGIMQTGKNYHFQVSAHAKDKDDFARPLIFSQHQTTAGMYTGVVTP